MDHALSTHLFVNHRLTSALLTKIQAAGIGAVEIFCARQHLDYQDGAQIKELGHWFRDSELKLHALHSPMYNDEIWGRSGPHALITITEPTKGERLRMVDEIKRAIELAETIPFRYLIQHVGVAGEEFDLRKMDAAFSALEQISLFARGRGVEVLLENTPNAFSSAERLLQFQELTHIGLNYCFDTGHAHMTAAGIEREFELMKPRIRSTHVHDNNGKDDLHLFPLSGGGTIDWKKTMGLLRTLPQGCPLLLELKERAEVAAPIEAVRETLDGLEHQ